MPYLQSTRVPLDRRKRDTCGHRSPLTGRSCNRHAGHRLRHHFAWLHIDGRVREVWS